MEHLTASALEAGLDEIRRAPTDRGRVALIVRRPDLLAREVVDEAVLDLAEGLLGDNWLTRGSRHTPDGSAEPGRQLTLMNVRVTALVAGPPDRWPLAGDQLYVDLDLSEENLPAGTRLSVGESIIEISELPHTGCAKFVDRFGKDALRFVSGSVGRPLRLRGANARVVVGGTVRVGDEISVLRGSSHP